MMKKYFSKTSLLFFIFTIMIISISCTQQKPSVPQTQKPPENIQKDEQIIKEDNIADYFPLSVGNRWEYEGKGMEYASYTQEVLYRDDNKYQVMIDNGGTVMANIYEISKDKIVNIYREPENYDRKNVLDRPTNLNIIMLQLPIKIGNKWVSEENSYEIIDINTKLTVSAGTFDDCIAVKELFKDGTAYQIYYYKKGIGMIKSEFFSDGEDIISSELKNYKINK